MPLGMVWFLAGVQGEFVAQFLALPRVATTAATRIVSRGGVKSGQVLFGDPADSYDASRWRLVHPSCRAELRLMTRAIQLAHLTLYSLYMLLLARAGPARAKPRAASTCSWPCARSLFGFCQAGLAAMTAKTNLYRVQNVTRNQSNVLQDLRNLAGEDSVPLPFPPDEVACFLAPQEAPSMCPINLISAINVRSSGCNNAAACGVRNLVQWLKRVSFSFIQPSLWIENTPLVRN